MSEDQINNLVKMFKSQDLLDVKLAQGILKSFRFTGKGSCKKKRFLECKILNILGYRTSRITDSHQKIYQNKQFW